jgi:hypothetical protein
MADTTADSTGKEQRKSPRKKTYAKILLEDGGILGYLRDLSKEGCQLAFLNNPTLQKGEVRSIEVLPDEQMAIPRFSMAVRIMWTREDPVYSIAGAIITSTRDRESEKRLARLFRYYA